MNKGPLIKGMELYINVIMYLPYYRLVCCVHMWRVEGEYQKSHTPVGHALCVNECQLIDLLLDETVNLELICAIKFYLVNVHRSINYIIIYRNYLHLESYSLM